MRALALTRESCSTGMIAGNVRRAYEALAAAVTRYATVFLVGLQHRSVARHSTACDGQSLTPVLGMVVAFQPGAEADLADVPARVVAIWPRLPSGAYLVTLEYARPIAALMRSFSRSKPS